MCCKLLDTTISQPVLSSQGQTRLCLQCHNSTNSQDNSTFRTASSRHCRATCDGRHESLDQGLWRRTRRLLSVSTNTKQQMLVMLTVSSSQASFTFAPAGWYIQERIGWPLWKIHAPVPLWNEKLRKSMQRYVRYRPMTKLSLKY